MFFAEDIAPSVEPNSRFFELCHTWMQGFRLRLGRA
jgi:hypothetical protein